MSETDPGISVMRFRVSSMSVRVPMIVTLTIVVAGRTESGGGGDVCCAAADTAQHAVHASSIVRENDILSPGKGLYRVACAGSEWLVLAASGLRSEPVARAGSYRDAGADRCCFSYPREAGGPIAGGRSVCAFAFGATLM